MTRIHSILWQSPDLPYYDQFELSSVSSFARFKQTFRTWGLTKDFKRTFHRAQLTCIGQFENHSKFLGETSHSQPVDWADLLGSVASFRTGIHETEQKNEHFRFPMLASQWLVGFDEDHFFWGEIYIETLVHRIFWGIWDCCCTWFALMVYVTIYGMDEVSITSSCQWIKWAILWAKIVKCWLSWSAVWSSNDPRLLWKFGWALRKRKINGIASRPSSISFSRICKPL